MCLRGEQDREHLRILIVDDLELDLFELERRPPHEVCVESHVATHDGRDREERFRLLPHRIGHDPARGPEVVITRPVEGARMSMPIAEVIDAETLEQEVEDHLLARGVRAEVHGGTLRPRTRADRERHNELVVDLPARKHAAALVHAVREAVGDDRAVRTLRQHHDRRHQNETPCRRQT